MRAARRDDRIVITVADEGLGYRSPICRACSNGSIVLTSRARARGAIRGKRVLDSRS